MRHVLRILGVPAQPRRERDMVRQQFLGIAAAAQPYTLGGFGHVEQADRDIDGRRSRCRQHFTRCNRVAGQQQMPALTVERLRPNYRAFGHSLTPGDIRIRRDRVEVAQLNRLDGGRELGSDRLPNRRLAGPLAPEISSSTPSMIAASASDLSPLAPSTP